MNALPPTLDRFGDELEDAVRRDLGHRRRRRRMVRGAVVLAAVAAAALGLLSAFGTGGPSVVDRAAAALQSSDDSILHYRFNATQQNGDGTTATWQQETWQLLVPPYTRRQIAIDTDSPRAESLSRGDLNELYDASDDTIYVATNKELIAARMPKIEIVSQSKLEKLTGSATATAVYLVGKGGGPYKVIATEEGARKLRRQLIHPEGQTSGVLPEEFRAEILALLKSGKVRVVGHVTVDGRDAIELESLQRALDLLRRRVDLRPDRVDDHGDRRGRHAPLLGLRGATGRHRLDAAPQPPGPAPERAGRPRRGVLHPGRVPAVPTRIVDQGQECRATGRAPSAFQAVCLVTEKA